METGKRKITEDVPSVMPQALPRVPGYAHPSALCKRNAGVCLPQGTIFQGLAAVLPTAN